MSLDVSLTDDTDLGELLRGLPYEPRLAILDAIGEATCRLLFTLAPATFATACLAVGAVEACAEHLDELAAR